MREIDAWFFDEEDDCARAQLKLAGRDYARSSARSCSTSRNTVHLRSLSRLDHFLS